MNRSLGVNLGFAMLLKLISRCALTSASFLATMFSPATGQVAFGDEALPRKDSFHLFVLAGQSNMAGRGEVTEDDRKSRDRVLMWTQDGHWAPAVDPLHFDKPKIVGVGPGRSFGIALADERREITVGLIPCAVGGSPIDCWLPGGYHHSTKTHPYDDAVARIRAASEVGTIKGILWHQGEGDSNANRADAYKEKLLGVLKGLRTECGGEVPVMLGQLGKFSKRPWNEFRRTVNWAHRQVALGLPHATFVSSAGLHPKSDNIHFNRTSAVVFGYRYKEAYGDLCNAIPSERNERIQSALEVVRQHLDDNQTIVGSTGEQWSMCHAWLTPEERLQAVRLIRDPEYWVAENLRGYPLQEQVSLLSAVDYLEASDELATRTTAVAEMWAAKDVDSAQKWLRKLKSDYCRGIGLSRLLETIMEKDPNASLTLLRGLNDQEAEDLIGYGDLPDFGLAPQAWADEVSGFESQYLRNHLQSTSVVWRFAKADVNAALRYVTSLPEAQQNSRQGWQIVAAWMQQQPPNAPQVIEWMESRLPKRLRSEAHFQGVAQWWHTVDREELVAWLEPLPPGEKCDAALEGFIGQESHSDVKSAYEWSRRISNEHRRQTVNERLLRRWMKFEPDIVGQILPAADLTEQQRKDLTFRLSRLQ